MAITKKQFDTWLNAVIANTFPKNIENPFGRNYTTSPILNLRCPLDNVVNWKEFTVPYIIPINTRTSTQFRGTTNYDSGVVLNSLRVFSPAQLEKTILQTVCRTKFESLEVTRGRYNFNFNKFSPELIKGIINFILSSDIKRVNYSWVPVLQDIILEHSVNKGKVKLSLNQGIVSDSIAPPAPKKSWGAIKQSTLTGIRRSKASAAPNKTGADKLVEMYEYGDIQEKTTPGGTPYLEVQFEGNVQRWNRDTYKKIGEIARDRAGIKEADVAADYADYLPTPTVNTNDALSNARATLKTVMEKNLSNSIKVSLKTTPYITPGSWYHNAVKYKIASDTYSDVIIPSVESGSGTVNAPEPVPVEPQQKKEPAQTDEEWITLEF